MAWRNACTFQMRRVDTAAVRPKTVRSQGCVEGWLARLDLDRAQAVHPSQVVDAVHDVRSVSTAPGGGSRLPPVSGAWG